MSLMKISFFYKIGGILGILILFSVVFISSAQESSESGKNLFLDFDQDGLSNDEEISYGTDPYVADTDGDGYTDYVEITSGYDPKKPAPGDKIIKDTEVILAEIEGDGDNLTEEVGAKLAGVVSTNLEEGEELTLQDINQVIQESISEKMEAPSFPEVEREKIKIQDQDYDEMSDEERQERIKEDAQEYLSGVAYVLAVQFPQLSSETGASLDTVATSVMSGAMQSLLSGNPETLNALAESGEKATEQLFEMEVPETLVGIHIKGLQFALYASDMKSKITVDAEDPLASIANLSLAQGLLVALQEFSDEVNQTFSDLGIDNIFSEI